jgi:hypothetical protein
MGMAGNKNRRAGQPIAEIKRPGHRKFFRDWTELPGNRVTGNPETVERPFDAHKKSISLGVDMLVGMLDIAVVLINEIGDRRSYSPPIRTGNE